MKDRDGKNYCGWCFITFESAEPRKYRGENSYHISCFNVMELKKLIVKEVSAYVFRKMGC